MGLTRGTVAESLQLSMREQSGDRHLLSYLLLLLPQRGREEHRRLAVGGLGLRSGRLARRAQGRAVAAGGGGGRVTRRQ